LNEFQTTMLDVLRVLQTPDPEFLTDARRRWDETNERLLGIQNALAGIESALESIAGSLSTQAATVGRGGLT